tara:strand:- start:881 stop:1582 length:702 start_codon:yes stop_codon:yes gene_type:complete
MEESNVFYSYKLMANYLRQKRTLKRNHKKALNPDVLFGHDALTIALKYPAVIDTAKKGIGVFLAWRPDSFDTGVLPDENFFILDRKSAIAVDIDMVSFRSVIEQAYKYNQTTLFRRLVERMKKICSQFNNFEFEQTDTHVQITYNGSLVFQEPIKYDENRSRDYRVIDIMQARIPIYQKLVEFKQSNPDTTIHADINENNVLNIFDKEEILFSFKFETSYTQAQKLHQHLGFA